MLGKKIEDALNDQLNYELYSAYVYAAMAAYFESIDLPGHASWMRVQVQEEMFHVTKFFGFICERDGRVRLRAVEEPPFEWSSPLAAFENAYEHECGVSSRIHALVDLARAQKDHAVENFLQWFVTEQVEEEASTRAVVQQLKFIGEDRHALFMIDRELAARVYTPPATGAA
jgi:ferritin